VADESIQCADCPAMFLFTEGERAFYESRGFSRPKRCKLCREKKRASRGDEPRAPVVEHVQSRQGNHRGQRGGDE
jgi:hypothetical protein